jgi:hypothetical protein
MSLESDLLLCCARTRLEPDNEKQLEGLLREDIDWIRFVEMAQSNRILPLLYCHVKERLPAATPGTVLNYLRRSVHMIALRNEILSNELVHVLALLTANGIPAFTFKGPALAAAIYGSTSLREFSDLDIMVHRRDFSRAKDLLLDNRYHSYFEMTGRQDPVHHGDFHAYTLRREDGRVDIDLHWKFAPTWASTSVALDLESLWDRLMPVSFEETEVLTLAPEDLLLALCIHGAKELWPNLRMICDVSELLRAHPEIDWDRVISDARGLRCERFVYLGLLLANELLDAPAPDIVLIRARESSAVIKVASHIPDRLFTQSPANVLHFETVTQRIRLIEKPWDKALSVLHVVRQTLTPNEQDQEVMGLPRFLSWAYYLSRPFRLLFEYGRDLLGYLFGRRPGARKRPR